MGEGPDFIGIGVAKSATTWVAARLNEHPGVYIQKKELCFWTHYYYRGYDWYHDRFKDKGERIAGEISPSYLITPRPNAVTLEHYPRWAPKSFVRQFTRPHPAARDEIRKAYPDIRIFAVFRNPVDRAWSHYWMWTERRRKRGKMRLIVPFEKMFRDNGRWIRTHGHYARHLKYWRDAFPDMGVFLFDDLAADPAAFIRSIYRFLGVDDTFVGDLADKPKQRVYDPMSAEIRRMLVDYYADEIREFSSLIGRDLSHWLVHVPGARRAPDAGGEDDLEHLMLC
ncbi:MAG: sulfotransferase [Candidatus Brocadiia bacterium]|jgi:hypothetical protein|nr:sulfotransferase [Candidatus Brocadiia bacterium]